MARFLFLTGIFSFFFLINFTTSGVLAQETDRPQVQAAQEKPSKDNKPADPIEKLSLNTKELLEGLDKDRLELVYATRMRDGIIRAVHYIHKMVSGAVDACKQAQPDMKEDLENRYRKWWATLEPLLEKAEESTKEKIEAQDDIDPDRIYHHLELVQEAAEYTQGKVEKEFVTDRKACQYLLDNMDVTEKDLSRQLKQSMETIKLPERDTELPSSKATEAAGREDQDD